MRILIVSFLLVILSISGCGRKRYCGNGINLSNEEVLINDSITFFAPNSLTPNGDGINDVFFITSNHLEKFENYQIKIKRNFKEIFSSTDPTEWWYANDGGSTPNRGQYNVKGSFTYKGEKLEFEGQIAVIDNSSDLNDPTIKNCDQCIFGDMIDAEEGYIHLTNETLNCK